MSDSLRPHGLQHTSLPCPSVFPGPCSNSYPSGHWCHPTILSSHAPFSSCLQSFPASGSFQMSQLFTSGGQRIGAPASVFSGWLPLGLLNIRTVQIKYGIWGGYRFSLGMLNGVVFCSHLGCVSCQVKTNRLSFMELVFRKRCLEPDSSVMIAEFSSIPCRMLNCLECLG